MLPLHLTQRISAAPANEPNLTDRQLNGVTEVAPARALWSPAGVSSRRPRRAGTAPDTTVASLRYHPPATSRALAPRATPQRARAVACRPLGRIGRQGCRAQCGRDHRDEGADIQAARPTPIMRDIGGGAGQKSPCPPGASPANAELRPKMLTAGYERPNNSGSRAMLMATRRASSSVSTLACMVSVAVARLYT